MIPSSSATSLAGSKSSRRSLKQDGKSTRLQQVEDEAKTLKDEVSRCLSTMSSQTKQLARQDKILNAMVDERKKAVDNAALIRSVFMMVVAFCVVYFYCNPMNMPAIGEDTKLFLRVKATPTHAPWITAGVKVSFTMGDLLSCVKGTFSGDTIGLTVI